MTPPLAPTLTDPEGPATPGPLESRVDDLLRPFLVDPRDVVFTRTAFEMLTRVLPAAVVLFLLPTWATLLAGLVYLPWLFVQYTGRVVLMVHQVHHRPLFRKRHRRFDRICTHLLPVFVGLTPGAYHAHHVLMHHGEENGRDDLSSTAAYRRDAPLHFLHYWARFTFLGYPHLASWLHRSGHTAKIAPILLTEASIFALFAAAVWLHPAAGFIVFVLPFLLLRFFLMAGNWAEHLFVDADDPSNPWRNSTILLNTRYNHRCYNAGYHLLHHVRPGLHWADNVRVFHAELPRLAEADAIVFDGVQNNQQIFWKAMTGDWGFLADRMVDVGGRGRTRDERIALLQQRARGRSGTRKGLFERAERR